MADEAVKGPLHPLNQQFLEILKQGKVNLEPNIEFGRRCVSINQRALDVTDATITIAHLLPPGEIENLIGLWLSWLDNISNFNRGIPSISRCLYSIESATSDTTAGTITTIVSNSLVWNNPDDTEIVSSFLKVIEKNDKKEQVIQLLTDLRLNDAYPGKKSPSEMLRESFLGFDITISDKDTVIGSLLSMRSCIHAVIEILFNRRPNQDPYQEAINKSGFDLGTKLSKSAKKVLSIGYQMHRDDVNLQTVYFWADNSQKIIEDQLTSAKNAIISREIWRAILFASTNFLHGFLSGLDPEKFRNIQ